ncbi:MAG: hypothetical protein ABIT76_03050 [Chthoniobacterales bacterium]
MSAPVSLLVPVKPPARPTLAKRFGRSVDKWLQRPGRYFITDEAMKRFGTHAIMGAARRYNGWRYAERAERHAEAYRTKLASLLRENGATGPSHIEIKDGYALDTSLSLPHLDALLEQADALVEERSGRTFSGVQQPFLRNLWFNEDAEKVPAVLDFITSSAVLEPVMRYLGTVPVLAKTRPGGIRLMESNAALDPGANGPFRESQLYHLDIHGTPLVYVLVAVRDIAPESGPWTFLPDSVSERACRAMNYGKRGMSYRVSDEEMYRHISPDERVVFSCPRGSVLFIDSSRCFHYGSRNAIPPRFQLMYAYTNVCRSDLSMTFLKNMSYPFATDASRLRKMVLK